MIDIIRPQQISLSDEGVTADMGAVLLSIECSHRDAQRLIDQTEIYCHLESDDTEFHLLGFASERRRSLYKSLCAVNGIGRKSALVVLDCGEAIDVLRAVAGKDKKFFREVPGVGDKRIGLIISSLGKRYADALPNSIPVDVDAWVEARDGLHNQGLTTNEAELRLQRAAIEGMSAEELLQAAQKEN